MVFGLTFFISGCGKKPVDDLAVIKGEQAFSVSPNITCTFLTSTGNDIVGTQINFVNLQTEAPQILWSAQKEFFPLQKLYDDMGLLGLRYRNKEAGYIETYLLNTNTGVFAVKRVGPLYGEDGMVSKGNCQ